MSSDSSPSIALVFPGQGSQYPGMGKRIQEKAPHLLELADKKLGFNLSQFMLEGPEETLRLTYNAQPAIVLHSYFMLTVVQSILEQHRKKIDIVLGHSVGEYSALVAAQVLTIEDALHAVHWRGRYMQEATPIGIGKMMAVLRADQNLVKTVCFECSDQNYQVMPANFNDPQQVVISGHKEACDKAAQMLKEKTEGKCRIMELNVSAPFHSTLMKPAVDKLSQTFNQVSFKENRIPYIANVNAQIMDLDTNPQEIRKNLLDQVAGSVLWTQSIEKLTPNTRCIEVGPGKVLSGLIKKINPELKVLSLDQENNEQLLQEFLQ